MIEQLDPRRQQELADEMIRRAEAVLGPGGTIVEPGRVEHALITVAARIGEEVTQRLDKVPDKQTDNFYSAMGIGRAAARPARVPVAFKLSDTAPPDLVAPAGTKLTANTGDAPTIFEIESGLDLARGSIARLVAVDLENDRIFVSPPGVPQARLPSPEAIQRLIVGGAAAGATVVQIAPATGLAKGMAISIETADGPVEYGISAVEGDLVTIDPPLAANVPEGAKVAEITVFAPFEKGARDQQSHALYLGHPTLLDLPSQATIMISGLNLEQVPEWSWFGKIDQDEPKPDWHSIDPDSAVQTATGWALAKPAGKPEKTPIDGHSNFWLRARLPGPSKQTEFGQTIRLSVGDPKTCKDGKPQCDSAAAGVGYEAIAVTTPVVPNKPYYPFGREPRLFDSFYVGCAEAFGKEGAHVSLCFEFGGPKLGPMAAVSDGFSTEVYGVGTDGQLWRAVISGSQPSFSPLPGLAESGGAGFAKQAFVAAQLNGRKVRAAIADDDAVYVGEFDYGTTPAKIEWTRLTANSVGAPVTVSAIFVSSDANRTVHAIAGTQLLSWTNDQSPATSLPDEAVDLLPVQDGGTPQRALLITKIASGADAGSWNVQLKRSGTNDLEALEIIDPSQFPDGLRAAWLRVADDAYYIAGFETGGNLIVTEVAATAEKIVAGSPDPQPIAFDEISNAGPDWPPAMVLASPRPTLFVPTGEDPNTGQAYDEVTEDSDIGVSDNDYRRLLAIDGWTIVQHADQGLLYRSSQGQQAVTEISFPGMPDIVIPKSNVPTNAEWLSFHKKPKGNGFYLAPNSADDRLLVPLSNGATIGQPDDAVFFKVSDPLQRNVTIAAGKVAIDNLQPTADVLILLTETSSAGTQLSIWHLPLTGTSLDEPPNFPAASNLTCVLLAEAVSGGAPQFREYFWLKDQSLATALVAGPLRSLHDPSVVIDHSMVDSFAGAPSLLAIPFPHDLLDGDLARLALTPDPWKSIGPDEPANPALSWEYWNGSAWWALDQSDFVDETADLQAKGGLYFTVPGDLEETEVGGQKDRWIRARLVGGDYGEARVTVTQTPGPNSSTIQSITRDLSAIRAPYVTKLTIIYCAVVPAKPQFVLGADNLGVVDRTGANDADVPVPVFPPVSTLFNPPTPPPARRIDDECCERWFEPDPGAAPEVEKKIDEQSCEHWFEQPSSGDKSDAPKPTRALMIGLDQQPRPSRLSVYLDLITRHDSTKLGAQFFGGGQFDDVFVSEDTTSGLAERGVVAVQVEKQPDLLELFGTAAYWLRITAASPDSKWAPQVRGIYLNGTMAGSVETRAFEAVGTSSGAPDQRFALAAPPIDPDSLILQVQEPIGEEEAKALGAASDKSGMPGPWVQWAKADSLDADPTARIFTLDAQAGVVTFGDGKSTSAVPPIGSAILAEAYKRVIGKDANNVKPGDKVDMLTPIVGVEQVIALDAAQGGIDIESAESARKRAPTKIRNQDSIVSLADLEEFVRARVQLVAQVRASNWRGGARVVVVASGADPVPPPSALEAVREAVGAASTYRLRARGILTVVGPRLLPLNVKVTIEPDQGQDFVTLERDAKARIAALLSHETGGMDGAGWPVGALPSKADIAAALEPLTNKAVVHIDFIARSDGRKLPDELPADVLVRMGDVAVELAKQVAA